MKSTLFCLNFEIVSFKLKRGFRLPGWAPRRTPFGVHLCEYVTSHQGQFKQLFTFSRCKMIGLVGLTSILDWIQGRNVRTRASV
jgi:hypothetical protein